MRLRKLLQLMLSHLDARRDSRVMDMLERGLNALPPSMAEVRFVKRLVFVVASLLGQHLGLSPAMATTLAKGAGYMLPGDPTMARWGKQIAVRWAVALSAHGMPIMAERVRITNGLITV